MLKSSTRMTILRVKDRMRNGASLRKKLKLDGTW
jgi:hypothetical protein